MYQYKITEVRVIDGDTIEALVDMGFHVSQKKHIRLLGIDTPELRDRDPEKKLEAQAAKEFVRDWFNGTAGEGFIKSHKGDSFGRWLAEIYPSQLAIEHSTDELGALLVKEGFAEVWER